MKTILCDIDGTIADFMPEWLRLYNEDYNDNLTVERITEWDIHNFVLPECGKNIYSYVLRPDFYSNVLPVPKSLEVITRLRVTYRVVFVTSGLVPEKIEWLYTWGFLGTKEWRYDPDFVVACDKNLIKGDVLIDDATHNCYAFSGRSLCFNQPWNQDYMGERVLNWDDILGRLGGYYG